MSQPKYMWHVSFVLSLHPDCSHTDYDSSGSPSREVGSLWNMEEATFLRLEAQDVLRRGRIWMGRPSVVTRQTRADGYPTLMGELSGTIP